MRDWPDVLAGTPLHGVPAALAKRSEGGCAGKLHGLSAPLGQSSVHTLRHFDLDERASAQGSRRSRSSAPPLLQALPCSLALDPEDRPTRQVGHPRRSTARWVLRYPSRKLCSKCPWPPCSRMFARGHRLRPRQHERAPRPPLLRDALTKTGCETDFVHHTSGVAAERPGWNQARAALLEGDTLVMWRLDWLGRSPKQALTRTLRTPMGA